MNQNADIKLFPEAVEIVGPTSIKLSANSSIEIGTSGFNPITTVRGSVEVHKELRSVENFSCDSNVEVVGSVNAYRFRSGSKATSYITINAGSLIIRDAQNKPKLQISANGDILSLGGDITICGGDLILEPTSDILIKMPNGEVVSLRNRLNL